MNSTDASASTRSTATRSPLACVPCRSRHLKCDGKRPYCTRCTEVTTQCHYAKSRRGGLDRAALAERRKRLATTNSTSSASTPIRATSSQALPQLHQDPGQIFQRTGVHIQKNHSLLDGLDFTEGHSGTGSLEVSLLDACSIEDDSLIGLYFKNFHGFHPMVLPRKHLTRHHQEPSRQSSLKPLIAVLRFIGHLYGSLEWSTPLKEQLESCFSEASATDPVMVQCRLLYSIALFWYGHKNESKQEMDAAVRLALDLEMFRREFAAVHGDGDPVLTESWRRTWWALYIVDAYIAGTLGTMELAVVNVEATVDLPCEECEYESGEIPEPKSLQDFDCREFAFGNTSFSSFAYLIGALRCVALAISSAPKFAVKEASPQVIHAADSIIDGWLLLLPENRKQVMDKTGEIDELMFQAHLLIHVATIGLHRPLSDLKFNAVEDVSSCARKAPLDTPTPELVNVHTIRVLRSVEAQIHLLALPVRPFHHSPFVTCMISEGILALLSACKFLLKDRELAIARDQIRMAIGCLKALAEVWPRTARNLREIQIIARHALGLESAETSSITTPSANEVPSLSGGEEQTTLGSQAGASSSDTFSTVNAMDDVYGWYNLGDLDPEFSLWTDGLSVEL